MLRQLCVAAVCAAFSTALAAQELTWWQGDLPGALAAAKESKAGMVLLYLWGDDDNCKAMFGDTFGDKAAKQKLVEFTCMGAQKGQPAGDALFAQFSIVQAPTCLFLQPDGQVVDAIAGFRYVQPFLAELQRIREGKETVAAMRQAAAAAPKDLSLQLKLCKKLRAIGDKKGGDAAIAAILAADPKGAQEATGEAQLLQVLDADFAGKDLKAVDTKNLKAFLGRQKHKRVQFLGYDRIAAVELAKDDLKAAAEATQKAWKCMPDDQALEWGQNVAAKAYGYFEELDKAQLKLALQISARSLKAAEAVAAERGNAFLANAYYTHACVQIVNNLRKEAFASMEKAIELDPANDNLKAALAAFKDGTKALGK
jgi:hypothetical protein